jgi:acylglycerol lipase
MTPVNQPVKAVVCYCHGYSDTPSYTKRKEFTYIVEQGIAVVMIDYEGHGRSDGTLGLIKDWDVMINDVNGYFQEVVAKVFPDKKIFLMGEV